MIVEYQVLLKKSITNDDGSTQELSGVVSPEEFKAMVVAIIDEVRPL